MARDFQHIGIEDPILFFSGEISMRTAGRKNGGGMKQQLHPGAAVRFGLAWWPGTPAIVLRLSNLLSGARERRQPGIGGGGLRCGLSRRHTGLLSLRLERLAQGFDALALWIEKVPGRLRRGGIGAGGSSRGSRIGRPTGTDQSQDQGRHDKEGWWPRMQSFLNERERRKRWARGWAGPG